jgi:hypothetical protein
MYQNIESQRTHMTVVISLIGVIIGFAVGYAQLAYIGSWELFSWTWMPLIPLYSALGWGLFGMIVGGSGIFLKKEKAEKEPTRSYPEAPAA